MIRRYVGRRLFQVLPTCAGILLLGFLLIHLAPGDPVLALAGDSGDEAYYDFMRDKFGLDEPLPTQLASYTGNVIRGDLGVSYVQGRPAAEASWERIPATLLLTATALVLSTILGVVIGILGASRRGSVPDHVLNGLTLGLYAAPVFWLGQLAILGFALRLGWFPVQGMTTARADYTGWSAVADVAHHLALPAIVLATQQLAAVSRLTRSGVVDELRSDHIRTARAKGVAEFTVLRRHALRRPLLPVVTVIGGRVGHLVAGTVVIETV
ncbi:MAG: ABC transporter permease, partial [Acidimicrobiales bacterium]|nr:ABC transporter permease [Acidimicrobiales bacterium]